MKATFFVGRLLFGGFFLNNGINHLKNYKALAPYAASKGLPEPETAVLASGVVLAAGGASIVLGVKPKIGAAALIGFLAVASGSMHDFWNSEDPAEKQNHLIHFSKNMALLGACLALAGVREPWPASLDIAGLS
ncbi:MAG: DoxX family protein [Acidobacteriota bacterium]|nr:DoxX family protein [Acidobacteriota bacterium]